MPPTQSLYADYQESQLQAAKLAWEQGHFKSQHAAAKHFKVHKQPFALLTCTYVTFQVCPQTLNDQINGIPCKKGSHESQQLLSKPQETVLHDWIKF
jgi:hypothetical protein